MVYSNRLNETANHSDIMTYNYYHIYANFRQSFLYLAKNSYDIFLFFLTYSLMERGLKDESLNRLISHSVPDILNVSLILFN